jgi:Glycosyl hydrolases family 18
MRTGAIPVILSCSVALGGCGGGGAPAPAAASTPTPAPLPASSPGPPLFAPYIDVTDDPPFSMTAMAKATGHKHYTLAFFQDGGSCTPEWGGAIPLSANYYADQIGAVRGSGGNVVFSFGGAAGVDLATSCASPEALQAAYQAVVSQYKATAIDLDVEGTPLSDSPSIDRRNKALRALEVANPSVKVSYTLPASPTGLTKEGLELLQNAVANGVRVDYVNVMAMDYGGPRSNMGQDAIGAAGGAASQVGGVGLQASIGVTVMIGQNDEAGEIFGLEDADSLLAFAKANGSVGLLSFWSAGRDNGGCPGQTSASSECSGIAQSDFAFTEKFKTF